MARISRRVALRTALGYAVFATAWILLSDRALAWFPLDAGAMALVQTGKGIAFVAVTTALLFVSVRRQVFAVRQADEARLMSEQRFRALFHSSMDAQIVLDSHGRILETNDVTCVRYGYSREELERMTVADLAPPRVRSKVAEEVARTNAVDERTFEWVHATKDGREVPVEIRARSLFLNGEQRILASIRDVTERRRLEEERLRHEADLERRVEERTADLERAKAAAESADHVKSAFLATMSHELRTPLNSIIGFSSLVLGEVPGPLNHEQKKQLGMVASSAQHLLALINDVLDLSKIEAGQLKVASEPFDVEDAVRAVTASIAPQFAQKGIAFEVAVDTEHVVARGERRRFEQVLLNLLSNALKFTEHGRVEVRVARVDGAVRTCVGDTGIGISPEDQQSLFLPFHQVDARINRRFAGTGLGLSISRRLVEAMGGEMRVESVAGRGSTFCFTVPAAVNAGSANE